MQKILKMTIRCQLNDVIMTSRQHLSNSKYQIWNPHSISFKIKYNLFDQNSFIVIKMTFKVFFMQKILKMTKKCQLNDVIMMS